MKVMIYENHDLWIKYRPNAYESDGPGDGQISQGEGTKVEALIALRLETRDAVRCTNRRTKRKKRDLCLAVLCINECSSI